MSSIVIYLSESGNTKKAAELIASKTNSDIEKLEPVEPYPDDYDELVKVSGHQRDNNTHPEITNKFNLNKYDTIYLGYPTWYHQEPMIIDSFFEKVDLKNKTVVPFTTTYNSEFSESQPFIEKLAEDNKVQLGNGFRANSEAEIESGLK